MTTTVIRNGLVITAADETPADVLIDGEQVVALAATGSAAAQGWQADTEHRRDRQVRDPRRRRRAHAHGDALRRHVRRRHLRDRHPGRGLGRHHHDRRLRHPVRRQRRCARAWTPGTPRPTGNCAIDYALPHDHGRRQRGLAQGDGGPGRRGRHQLQAVHGLPRRVLQRRRQGPARAAEGRRDRRADHDARRERHRHRRAGGAGAGPRAHRPALPRRGAARAAGGRGHPPGDQAGPGGRRADLHRAPVRDRGAGRGGRGPRRGAQRLRRDLPAVPVPVHRRPGPARLRGRQVRLLDAAAARPSTRPRCGAGCAPTTCRWCPPTTARSASRARRSWASATSPRSPTGCRAWRHRMDLLHQAVLDGHISPAALDRDRLRHPGPDVRPLPAQGHHRARLRRRHRALRPDRAADPVRARPTTWTSTTPATRAGRSPAGWRPCSPAGE